MTAICMHTDAWLTSAWTVWHPTFLHVLYKARFVMAFLVIAFSVGDLLLTQTLLTMIEGQTGVQAGEANAFMAPVIMTWWAWPIRVGIPLFAVSRDLYKRNYNLMLFATILYGAVVAWNTHMYFIVRGAL